MSLGRIFRSHFSVHSSYGCAGNTSSMSKIANPKEKAAALVFTFYHLRGWLSKGPQVGWYKQVCVTSWFSGLLLHSQSVWEGCLFKNKPLKLTKKPPNLNHPFLYFIYFTEIKQGREQEKRENKHREGILSSKQNKNCAQWKVKVKRSGLCFCITSTWKNWPSANKDTWLLTRGAPSVLILA